MNPKTFLVSYYYLLFLLFESVYITYARESKYRSASCPKIESFENNVYLFRLFNFSPNNEMNESWK